MKQNVSVQTRTDKEYRIKAKSQLQKKTFNLILDLTIYKTALSFTLKAESDRAVLYIANY